MVELGPWLLDEVDVCRLADELCLLERLQHGVVVDEGALPFGDYHILVSLTDTVRCLYQHELPHVAQHAIYNVVHHKPLRVLVYPAQILLLVLLLRLLGKRPRPLAIFVITRLSLETVSLLGSDAVRLVGAGGDWGSLERVVGAA